MDNTLVATGVCLFYFALFQVTTSYDDRRGMCADTSNYFLMDFEQTLNSMRGAHGVPPVVLDKHLSKCAVEEALFAQRHQVRSAPHAAIAPCIFSQYPSADTLALEWYCKVLGIDFCNKVIDNNAVQFARLMWKNVRRVGIGKLINHDQDMTTVAALVSPMYDWWDPDDFEKNVPLPQSNQLIQRCLSEKVAKVNLNQLYSLPGSTEVKLRCAKGGSSSTWHDVGGHHHTPALTSDPDDTNHHVSPFLPTPFIPPAAHSPPPLHSHDSSSSHTHKHDHSPPHHHSHDHSPPHPHSHHTPPSHHHEPPLDLEPRHHVKPKLHSSHDPPAPPSHSHEPHTHHEHRTHHDPPPPPPRKSKVKQKKVGVFVDPDAHSEHEHRYHH